MTPFDFINSITYNKEDLFVDPQAEKDYVPFIVNRGLSYFPDTLFYANEVNQYSTASKKWQYDFLRLSIAKKKRFSKWAKKESLTTDVALVQEWYKYSEEKAIEALTILTDQQLKAIRDALNKGGK